MRLQGEGLKGSVQICDSVNRAGAPALIFFVTHD
jgi:hypothetical protein